MSGVPDAVQAAAARWSATTAEKHSPIRRGQLRVAHPVAFDPVDARLVLILSLDSENEFAEVLLVHPAPELATSWDVVVAGSRSNAPYSIVVQTDLRGIVWTLQLGKIVGDLDEATMDALGAATGENRESAPGLETGVELAGRLDSRWQFKRSEGEALRRLSTDCTSALLDRGMTWVIDLRLLRPELLDSASDPLVVIHELFHWFDTREVTIADEDLELAVELLSRLNSRSWGKLSDVGLELISAFAQRLELAWSRSDRPSALSTAGFLSVAGFERLADHSRFDAVHQLGRQEATVA